MIRPRSLYEAGPVEVRVGIDAGFTRRRLLRNGLLAGAGTAALFAVGVPLAGSARADSLTPSMADGTATLEQFNWCWCNQCSGLFWVGTNHAGRGWCSGNRDGESHASTSSYSSSDYGLFYNAAPAQTNWQDNWFWCRKCASLFWGGTRPNQSVTYGVCPVGQGTEPHDGSASSNYTIATFQFANYQSGWNYCFQCAGLFWTSDQVTGQNSGGICPIDGGTDASGGYYYHLSPYASSFYYLPSSGKIPL